MIVGGGRVAGGAVAGGGGVAGGMAGAGGMVAGGGGAGMAGAGMAGAGIADAGAEAGCAGACGGAEAMCIQAEGALKTSQWRFVGAGRGGYEAMQSYNFVGQGCGSYVVEEVSVPYGWKVKPMCIGLVVLVALVPLVLLLMPQGPTTTTTIDTCAVAVTEAQKADCCRTRGVYCTTTAPPTPKPKAYDCNEGFANAAAWSVAKKDYCCKTANRGCAVQKKCTLWGDPHIISLDQIGEVKSQALSFYGDGDFWLVRSSTVSIQGRFEGTKYTEGLAATNQIVVGGAFLNGHKIEVGTRQSGILTVDGQPVFASFPGVPYKAADGSFTVAYDSQGEVPDVVPEGNEKRIVRMSLPLGVTVNVFQWFNYLDVTVSMSAQPGQDGVCGNFNGNQADDTTATIMQRIGARVKPGESLLSGQANIEFTPQMAQMMAAECPQPTLAQAQAQCTTSLGQLVSTPNLLDACKFDTCFGMNVRARSHAKMYH